MNGILVQMLHFADDIVMIADSEENIEIMLQNIDNTLNQEYNREINKTTILVCNRQQLYINITIDNMKLENVNSFAYLGNKITNDEKSITVINCRIA